VPLVHYLLVYDHKQEKLLEAKEFTNAAEAAAAYAELEANHREDSNLEIVLVGADSLETIRLTHGNYFDGETPAALDRLARA